MKKKRTKLSPSQLIALNEISSFVHKKTNINIKEYVNFRDEELIRARTLFFMIALKKLTIGYASLGSFINKDHASVYHAKKIWQNYLSEEFEDYFNEFFNGKSKITKKLEPVIEFKDDKNKTINLTKTQISVFNEFKKLNDSQLLEFNETRLKPYLKTLESRVEAKIIPKVVGASLNREKICV